MEDVVLTAVCDLDVGKARGAAERYGARASYEDAAEMLAREALDFVDIVTTMESHAKLFGLAASHGLPVIVQKPLAPSWKDCVAIVETARAAGVPFMVHENTRFLTPLRKAHEVIDSGAIGKPTWARVSFRTGHNIYGKQPYLAKADHFVILDLGAHARRRALSHGRSDASLLPSAERQAWNPRRGHGDDPPLPRERRDDRCRMQLREPDLPRPVSPARAAGRGNCRQPATEPGLSAERLHEGTGERKRRLARPCCLGRRHRGTARRVHQHWVQCLREGREPETSGADSLKTYGLVFSAYTSAGTGDACAPLV